MQSQKRGSGSPRRSACVPDRRPVESSPSQSGLVMSVTKVNEVTHLPAPVPGRSLVYNGDGKWKGEITLSLWITAERRRM